MKKRILSLILVVVMLALTLTSCSYNFSKDDMSNYVEFDAETFKAALLKLVIEDGAYTTDPETNKIKIEETIRNTIGGKADLTKKLYEGTVGQYDILYYAYYCTADFKNGDAVDEDVIIYAAGMKEASAIKLQLGMASTAGDLDKAITEALKEKDIKDYLYETNVSTTTEVKAGDVVYVSYTYSYTDANGATKNETATYEKITLGDDDFSKKIIEDCKKVGTKKDFTITVDGVERSYKNAMVDWVVNKESKLGEFDVKDFDDTKSVTDVYGTARKLSDAVDGTITYHVYPVYFVKTADFTASVILDTLLGKDITPDVFELFGDESYKTTVDGKEVTLATLVEELAAVCSSRDSAKTSLTNAQTTLDTKKATLEAAGENATDAQKNAVTTAQTALETAQTNFDNAQAKVDAKIANIFATGEDMESKIIEAYRELTADSLKNEYDSEVILNAAKEVWKLIEESVKINSYPEKAVKEMYERILDEHEYKFNTATKDTTNKISYYKYYNGSFKAYLIGELTDKGTYEDALAVIRKSAEEAIAPMVMIYAVSEAYDCVVSDKDFKNDFIKSNSSYESYVEYYGEQNVRIAYQFNTLLYEILEVETYDEDEGDHKKGEMKEYVDGKLPFKNIKYEIKVEEESTEEKTEG